MSASESASASTSHPTPPLSASIPLPLHTDVTLHISLTPHKTCLLIFMTTTIGDAVPAPAPPPALSDSSVDAGFQASASVGQANTTSALGSFVYGMPNRLAPSSPLTTPLVTTSPQTVDLAVRICRLLVLKHRLPVYLGCSIDSSSSTMAPTVEEEMEVVRAAVEGVRGLVERKDGMVNGDGP